jgi:pimeloyl-ACP methyl ester carboxylesterase
MAEELAEQATVVAPDLRGHGTSPHGRARLLDHLRDLDAVVGQHRVCMVGHSMGALIAACYASARPLRVHRLVLIEPALPSDRPADLAARWASALDRPPAVHSVMPNIGEAGDRLIRAIPALSPAWATSIAHRITRATEGGLIWRWDPALRFDGGDGLDRDATLALLASLPCPVTLVFAARSDRLRKPDIEALLGAMPHATVATLDSSSHHVHLTHPSEVAALVDTPSLEAPCRG